MADASRSSEPGQQFVGSISFMGVLLQETDTSETWHINLLGFYFDFEIDRQTLLPLGGEEWSRPRRGFIFKPLPARVSHAILTNYHENNLPALTKAPHFKH